MRVPRARSLSVATFVLLAPALLATVAVCDTKPRAPAGAPAAAPGKPDAVLTDAQAVAAASAWLDALKARDAGALARKTRFPFRFASTAKKPICEGVAADPSALGAMVTCLGQNDRLFLTELAAAGTPATKPVAAKGGPRWLAKLWPASEPGDRLVSTFINGDGVTFELVLVVADAAAGGLVRAFLLHGEVEAG